MSTPSDRLDEQHARRWRDIVNDNAVLACDYDDLEARYQQQRRVLRAALSQRRLWRMRVNEAARLLAHEEHRAEVFRELAHLREQARDKDVERCMSIERRYQQQRQAARRVAEYARAAHNESCIMGDCCDQIPLDRELNRAALLLRVMRWACAELAALGERYVIVPAEAAPEGEERDATL